MTGLNTLLGKWMLNGTQTAALFCKAYEHEMNEEKKITQTILLATNGYLLIVIYHKFLELILISLITFDTVTFVWLWRIEY